MTDATPDTPITPTSFEDLGLHPLLLQAVAEDGYTQPTPIQVEAIPAVLAGRDVIGGAETGSGKTAAFVLPILQRLLRPSPEIANGNRVRALVLAPTRELAIQIATVADDFAAALDDQKYIKVSAAFGGVKINPQMLELRGGTDLLVATPGRLLDLVAQNAIRLGQVEMLVLDEADRLLSMGFSEELAEVFSYLPKNRQSLMFSATFPDEVRDLMRAILHDPIEVNIEKEGEVLITQRVFAVDKERKNALLAHLINTNDWQQVLVFASAKHSCDRFQLKLKKAGIKASAFHGDMTQGARNHALDEFKRGKTRVLIATDVAARGIDIPKLPCVINAELPRSPNDYIHRIGRTGRAGQPGTAIALINPEEYAHFRVIEKRMKIRLEREVVAGFEPPPEELKPKAPKQSEALDPPSDSAE